MSNIFDMGGVSIYHFLLVYADFWWGGGLHMQISLKLIIIRLKHYV